MSDTCGGVDGCRTGWVLATVPVDGPLEFTVTLVPSFADLVGRDPEVLGVDMPIGLAQSGPRACDVAARRLLGPRRSSVFPAPPRSLLACRTWEDARGISKQTFHLLPKMAEVDDVMTPALQARVREVHPELGFARLAGGAPMAHPKRTLAGRLERLAALGLHEVPARLRGAAADDVLDACAVATVARRLVTGEVDVLGDGAVDERGLRMEIVW